jgi:hypothetical protein
MDITAHEVTLVSIIIGIGLTEMFGNLHRLIRNRARVIWDWLPVMWAATLLLLVINFWWSIFFAYGAFQHSRNAAEFGLLLITPILLFLATASVLPNFDADSTWDMRAHYGDQRRTFIGTYILYQCSTWTTAAIIGTLGFNVPSIIRATILLMLVLALLLNRRSLDWVAAIIIFAGLSFRLSTQVAQ